VVPLAERESYMAALEQASVQGDIKAFAQFLGGLVKKSSKAFTPHSIY